VGCGDGQVEPGHPVALGLAGGGLGLLDLGATDGQVGVLVEGQFHALVEAQRFRPGRLGSKGEKQGTREGAQGGRVHIEAPS
jgi:hypothetical protein